MSSSDKPDQSITLTLVGQEAAEYLISKVLQSDDKRLNELKATMSIELKAALGTISTTNVELREVLATMNGRLDRVETAIARFQQTGIQEAPVPASEVDGNLAKVMSQPSAGRPRSWASVFSFGIL